MRVLILSSSLVIGGAERQIVALARGLHRLGHHVAVAVFYPGGGFEPELRAEGIPVHDLRRRGRWDLVAFPARLARLVRAERPDVVQSYLGGPNFFAAVLKPLFPSAKVVWGIRSAARDLGSYDWVTRLSPLAGWATAWLADAIVANSHAAQDGLVRHRAVDAGKVVVIPNGVDCERFRADPDGRARLRREWAIPDGAPLVGMVARLDRVKNHANFLRAAALAAGRRPDLRVVCIGGGDPAYLSSLRRLASDLGLADRLTWAGARPATSAVYSALDVKVLSSDSESFPNAVVEAMACGTPVVATAVGDVPRIVDGAGIVVPPRDPVAMADAIEALLRRPRAEGPSLGDRARARIASEYSLDAMVSRTERLFSRVAAGSPTRAE